MRKNVRDVRRVRPKNPRSLLDEGRRGELARALPLLLHLRCAVEPFVLHEEHEAVLQNGLRQVNKGFSVYFSGGRSSGVVFTKRAGKKSMVDAKGGLQQKENKSSPPLDLNKAVSME